MVKNPDIPERNILLFCVPFEETKKLLEEIADCEGQGIDIAEKSKG